MIVPKGFGGSIHFNLWANSKIEFHISIEYIQSFADKNGVRQKPTAVVTFNASEENKTEMTVTEYANFGQIKHFAKLGLEQSLNKVMSIITTNK
ncbi:hypothetical protein [Niastella koreensis]|nr:hypothetical protein [Niastella koreensis]